MIDLHTHTVCSDGADQPEAVLRGAAALGLGWLSITDHNTVAAYADPALRGWRQLYSGRLIPGVEITCMFGGEVVEVLGYGFSLPAMREQLKTHVLGFAEKQQREFALICTALAGAGLHFEKERVQFDPGKESCRKAFLRELNRHPENQSFFGSDAAWESSRAFARQEIYNPESRLYVDESPLYPAVETAVRMIHESGGVALWAHLYIYSHAAQFRAQLETLVPAFGLDGMECAHSAFTPEQIADLEGFCRAHGLLCSGGSDYHGSRKPDYALGTGRGQLNISEKFLQNWPETVLRSAEQPEMNGGRSLWAV